MQLDKPSFRNKKKEESKCQISVKQTIYIKFGCDGEFHTNAEITRYRAY